MQKFQYVRHKKVETLIDFLCRRFLYLSRDRWTEYIMSGAVTIDGHKAKPERILESKMVIGYQRPREDEPKIDTSYNILYEDKYIVVVEKNGNIPVSESGKYYLNTLLNILKEGEGYEQLNAVHRLDRETSGVLVIARNAEIATVMGKQFAAGTPQKTYNAVLVGELKEERLIDAPIKKSKQPPVFIRQIIAEDGKPSQTLFTPLEVKNGLSLVKVKTFTGRTHQIRLHSEYMGLPILGDKLYGQPDERFLQIVKEVIEPTFPPYGRLDRQLLHAAELTFTHPVTEEKMTFKSDCASYFKKEFTDYDNYFS